MFCLKVASHSSAQLETWLGRRRETCCTLKYTWLQEPASSPEQASLASTESLGPRRHSGLCDNTAEVWGGHLFIQVPGSTVLHVDKPVLCSAPEKLRESVSHECFAKIN